MIPLGSFGIHLLLSGTEGKTNPWGDAFNTSQVAALSFRSGSLRSLSTLSGSFNDIFQGAQQEIEGFPVQDQTLGLGFREVGPIGTHWDPGIYSVVTQKPQKKCRRYIWLYTSVLMDTLGSLHVQKLVLVLS